MEIRRLEAIHNNIYYNEVQDLTGYDINLLRLLMKSSIAVTCYGDKKQSTFKTYVTTQTRIRRALILGSFIDRLKKKVLPR